MNYDQNATFRSFSVDVILIYSWKFVHKQERKVQAEGAKKHSPSSTQPSVHSMQYRI